MAITTVAITGNVLNDGSGVWADVTFTPLTKSGAIVFPGDGFEWGPRAAETDRTTGAFSINIPVHPTLGADLLWRVTAKAKSGSPVVDHWLIGNYSLTVAGRLDAIVDNELTAVTATFIADVLGARDAAETARTGAETAEAGAVAVATGDLDPANKALIELPTSQTALALSETIATEGPQAGFVMQDASETTATGTSILPIGHLDEIPYGRHATNGSLYKTTDDGATWTLVNSTGGIAIHALGDGEILLNQGTVLQKSSGWAADPTTATFSTVVSGNGTSGFLVSDVDTYANLVICSEYVNPRTDARYVRVSTDSGSTFSIVRDLDAMHPGQEDSTHWHAVCIDPFHTGPNPRLWASYGDGPKGVIYSDDLGATWTVYGPPDTWQPMPLCATPNGIVTMTDQNNPDGVWLIPRDLGPRRQLARIPAGFWLAALLGFGIAAVRDERTGIVYMTFRSDQQTYFTEGRSALMYATDGIRADLIYSTVQKGTVGVSSSLNWNGRPALTKSGKLLASYTDTGGTRHVVKGRVQRGTPRRQLLDEGNILTGKTVHRDSIAIGYGGISPSRSVVVGVGGGIGAVEQTDERIVAVGQETEVRTNGTVVGFQAKAQGTFSTAVGSEARVASTEGVAVGSAATAWQNSVALGRSSTAGTSTKNNAVAIGRNSNASESGAAAVGTSAAASGLNATAFGIFASAVGQDSAAIGPLASAGATYALAFGRDANAAGGSAIAAGRASSAANTDGIAIGQQAIAGTGTGTIVIGKSAAGANFLRSVALGSNTTVTASDQVQFNGRHIEADELTTDPAAPAVNKGRLYYRDNGAGKTQLCVRFNTGAIQVLSTEP